MFINNQQNRPVSGFMSKDPGLFDITTVTCRFRGLSSPTLQHQIVRSGSSAHRGRLTLSDMIKKVTERTKNIQVKGNDTKNLI